MPGTIHYTVICNCDVKIGFFFYVGSETKITVSPVNMARYGLDRWATPLG